MIPIKKEWIAGGLILASAGVWIPQFLDSGTDDTPRPIVGAQEELDLRANESPKSPLGLETGPDQGGATTSPATPLEEDIADASGSESFQGSGANRDLASLLQSLASEAEEPSSSLDPRPTATPVDDDLEALRAFSEEHPLRGAILGPDGGVALLGHRIVHIGDALAGGRGQLEEIGAGWVTIECGTSTLRMDLPPFVARTGSPTDSGQPQDTGSQAPETSDGGSPPVSMDLPTEGTGQGGAQ